jgi:hypothetical protein
MPFIDHVRGAPGIVEDHRGHAHAVDLPSDRPGLFDDRQVLADGEPHAKSEAEWGFPIHKSTLTHHFKTLRYAGLTRTITAGRKHAIQLRRPELDARFPGLIDALTAPTPEP